MPQEELQYKFRRDPYSVHIKWVGLEGQGRELIYVAGKYDDKVQILTGQGEGLIVPAGMRVARLPTDKDVRSKSRHDIREGGMGMAVQWFGKVAAIIEKDPAQAKRMKYLGVVKGRPGAAGRAGGGRGDDPAGLGAAVAQGGQAGDVLRPGPGVAVLRAAGPDHRIQRDRAGGRVLLLRPAPADPVCRRRLRPGPAVEEIELFAN